MRAIVKQKREAGAVITEVEDPRPRPGEVLVSMKAALTREDLDEALGAFERAGKALGLI